MSFPAGKCKVSRIPADGLVLPFMCFAKGIKKIGKIGKPDLVFGMTEARDWSKSTWCTTEDTAKVVRFYLVGNGTHGLSPALLCILCIISYDF